LEFEFCLNFEFWRLKFSSSVSQQSEFTFGTNSSQDGYSRWLAGRQVATAELARRAGLPLGHLVEIWLKDGVMLRGKLRLKEEFLLIDEDAIRHLELTVDRVTFCYRDMDSCVRLD